MNNSRIKIAGLLILVLVAGLLFISACSSAHKDNLASTESIIPAGAALQGNIFDGKTGVLLANASVKINIYQTANGRWSQVFTDTQKADAKGNYLFNLSAMDTLPPNSYLEYILEKDGYVASRYTQMANDKTTLVTLNFGMIKSDGEIVLSGKVMNAVDRVPIADVKIKLQLTKQSDIVNTDSNATSKGPKYKTETLFYTADKEGNYQAKIPASYMPDALNRTSYFMINPELAGFEVATAESRVNGKSESNIDFTIRQTGYYLVDEKQEGVLKGALLDKDGKPMANVPVIVKLGQRKG